MQSILVVGAGREGKGFLGETFSTDGWQVYFLDKDPEVVNALKTGKYNVTVYQENGTFKREITGYEVYGYDEEYSCLPAVLEAEVIALCLYPEDIPEAAAYLGKGISERARRNGDKLTILCCTNKNHYIPTFKKAFENALEGSQERAWFSENAIVTDVIVRRSTNAETTTALDVVTTATMSLLIQPPVYADFSKTRWMELRDGLEQLKEIKLYTYNAPHAACAYAGYLKGYKTILEASADPEIAALQDEVLKEAIPGLSKEFGIPEEEIWAFCSLPRTKEEMDDSIYRVAVDPIRKLSRNDRLTGNAMFCFKHGIDPKALIKSIANGMAYDEPRDEKAMLIQNMIREEGIEAAIAKVCGVSADHDLVTRVAAEWRSFIYEAYSILPEHLREAAFQPMLHQFRSAAARFAGAIADNGTDLSHVRQRRPERKLHRHRV